MTWELIKRFASTEYMSQKFNRAGRILAPKEAKKPFFDYTAQMNSSKRVAHFCGHVLEFEPSFGIKI